MYLMQQDFFLQVQTSYYYFTVDQAHDILIWYVLSAFSFSKCQQILVLTSNIDALLKQIL